MDDELLTLIRKADEIVPAEATHIGFIPQDVYGRTIRVTVLENAPDGVSSTFAKCRRASKNESASEALQRCIKEQIYPLPVSIFPIPYVWSTANSLGFYFTGAIGHWKGGDDQNDSTVAWLSPTDAKTLLGQSKNTSSRRRDVALIDVVAKVCVDSCRRVLLMTRELHKKGYEKLRVVPYIYSMGTWRALIVLDDWTRPGHGGYLDWENPIAETSSDLMFRYTSANRQEIFDNNSEFLAPADLAERFLWKHRELARLGRGDDPEYVKWLEDAIERTHPHGIFMAETNFSGPWDYLEVWGAEVDRVPLPPVAIRYRR